MIIILYINKFEELKIRCRGFESPEHALARFEWALRPKIQRELIGHVIYAVDDVV